MTQSAGLLMYRLARAASIYSRLVLGLEALLPLSELSVPVLVSMERKRSYYSVLRMNVGQEGHESV